VLIHTATGGVGMAAMQIARHLGAQVFATASTGKWDVLRSLGLDNDHIASSRDLDFKEKFLNVTDSRGVDVVLNSLAHEAVDASLDLLPRGGHFLEMGKTDVRDPETVAHAHPGVRYRAFDLIEAGLDRSQQMLGELLDLFARGDLRLPPTTASDVRCSVDAFRTVREARHVGKVVLTIPKRLDPAGTILITGGTGGLGSQMARHLAREHGAQHLLLVSRRGDRAEGADQLVEELAEAGCDTRVAACDVSDQGALRDLIESIPPTRPLRGVIHAAGVLADGTLESLQAEHVDRAMRPKADAAWHLHELTTDLRLDQFVLFSSAAGALGSPGQGPYAAANAFLDALAQRRRAHSLPALSLGWGLWEQPSGMTGALPAAELTARMERMGMGSLSSERALELFDQANGAGEALVAPLRFQMAVLRSHARAGVLPPFLAALVRAPGRRVRDAHDRSLTDRLAAATDAERHELLLGLVLSQVATVLGHASPDAIAPERKVIELGLDSLGAVELRNRLARATGVRLPATLAFDHPTPAVIARYLRSKLAELTPSGHVSDANGDSPLSDAPEETLSAVVRHAQDRATMVEFIPMLMELSKFCPEFSSVSEIDAPHAAGQLSTGAKQPSLICIPSFVAGSGPHQFVRFAKTFEGVRSVSAVSLPGFGKGDRLPASWSVAIEALAKEVRRIAEDEPYALIGYSAGGAFAHAVTEKLDAEDFAPSGVVMIDSVVTVDSNATDGRLYEVFADVMCQALDHHHLPINDQTLIAMATYMRLVSEWHPNTIAAPSLLIRATQPLTDTALESDRLAAWQAASTTVEVEGDHFSIISENADTAAQATEAWLSATIRSEDPASRARARS
jgi:NADPH:quinone reductase-like Zn-dependent oxidoreductase/thioesterase domain-containing protein/acyl carrier protein